MHPPEDALEPEQKEIHQEKADRRHDLIWVAYINTMDGWFSFYMPSSAQIKMFIAVFAGYAAVTVLDFRRIRKIPMDTALKNMD